jgi:hypothetical protein
MIDLNIYGNGYGFGNGFGFGYGDGDGNPIHKDKFQRFMDLK